MSSAITALGQTRINQLRGEEKPLVIDRMVLALVPGLDPAQPVDRNQQMPDPAHVVHTHTIVDAHKGYVNPDQVVYSMILGSDVGDFSFNWIGTVEAVTGNVITVTTTPETPKRKTNLGTNTTGNNITRNVMMRFQDAQALTGVSVSAETWQFDYTTWMTARIGEHDGDVGAHGGIRGAFAQHAGNKANPHGVTAEQTGACTEDKVKTLFNQGIGKIDFFDCEVPPTGWLEANGGECPEASAVLNALLAGRHGVGVNGRSLLPDLRGEFVRGWDHGRGVDLGRNLGSNQLDEFKAHNHKFNTYSKSSPGGGAYYGTTDNSSGVNTSTTGGTETRPRNVAMLVCIYAGI